MENEECFRHLDHQPVPVGVHPTTGFPPKYQYFSGIMQSLFAETYWSNIPQYTTSSLVVSWWIGRLLLGFLPWLVPSVLSIIWRCPEMGVPPNHPGIGFSTINHPAIRVPPWLWKPSEVHICSHERPNLENCSSLPLPAIWKNKQPTIFQRRFLPNQVLDETTQLCLKMMDNHSFTPKI